MEEVTVNGLMLSLMRPLVFGGGLLFGLVFPALIFVESILGLFANLFTNGDENE